MSWEKREEYERLLEYPFDFESYIQERLRGIDDLDERIFAKMVLEEGLLNVIRVTEDKYQRLEKRVFDEIENKGLKYAVYTTICDRNVYDPINEFLFQMVVEPEEKVQNIGELKKLLDDGKKPEALNFYFSADYSKVKCLKESDKLFSGTILTKEGPVAATFSIQFDDRYMKEVERLYHLYRCNEIPWVTINCAYLMRFFRVQLETIDEETSSASPITGYHIDFGELEPFIQYNCIPLWNVRKILVKSADFMIPCIDIKAWDHKISLENTGLQNVYLIEPNDVIIDCRRESAQMVITTSVQELPSMDMFMVAQKGPALPLKYTYPVFSNAKKDSFIKRYTEHTGIKLCTRAELVRRIRELEDSDYVEFLGDAVVESGYRSGIYNMNPFLSDEWADPNSRRILLLRFKAKNEQRALCEDIVSFIVSEIQLTFDEYRCEGMLI